MSDRLEASKLHSHSNEAAGITKTEEQKNSLSVHPSFREAFSFWLKLGFISFGGPAGQISIMHHELVERRRWLSNERFLNALNYCMLLPGPEAQQLAIYIGWLLHRIPGGVVAGALFVIPSMFVLFALSYVYVVYGSIPWVVSIFAGLKPAVMAIVAAAVIRIGKKALKNEIMVAIAAAAFVAIYFFKVPFPVIVLGAGVVGLTGGFFLPQKFNLVRETGTGEADAGYVVICPEPDDCHVDPSMKRNLILFAVFVLLWLGPMLLFFLFSSAPMFFREGLFFTKAAFLTFGGAYAVLPYIAQAGVEQFSWLTPTQMMDGLGLAETTPGPLIMVVQFVGFMAGWNYPGSLSPVMGGLVGSLVATYFTFLPCFLFIFLGGPYIEKFRENVRLSTFLSGITAAVVGVVLNLAVWFGMHVLFLPETGFNWFGAIIGIATFVALQWGRLGIVTVVLLAGGLGLASHFVLF